MILHARKPLASFQVVRSQIPRRSNLTINAGPESPAPVGKAVVVDGFLAAEHSRCLCLGFEVLYLDTKYH
jgi:hypothetical protein